MLRPAYNRNQQRFSIYANPPDFSDSIYKREVMYPKELYNSIESACYLEQLVATKIYITHLGVMKGVIICIIIRTK